MGEDDAVLITFEVKKTEVKEFDCPLPDGQLIES